MRLMVALRCLCFLIFISVVAIGLPLKMIAQPFIYADVYSLSITAKALTEINLGEIERDYGFYLVPYYLQVQFPANNFTAWGIQLYSNNCPDKNWIPIDGLYGGLRGTEDPLKSIPLYWQVYSTPPDTRGTWDTPESVTTTARGLAFYPETLRYWGRVRDRNDEDIVQEWLDENNIKERTLAGHEGLGKYPLAERTNNQPPIYIYLGMNVSQAFKENYSAVINLDLYNLGIGIGSGGYATPNPFTPVTGQKTYFNFFLKNMDSAFSIKIYTVRGRLIRTITTEREWDGRNEAGRIVEGGLYIYQVEADQERVSGTVVLIK